jgi:hypothetical protein
MNHANDPAPAAHRADTGWDEACHMLSPISVISHPLCTEAKGHEGSHYNCHKGITWDDDDTPSTRFRVRPSQVFNAVQFTGASTQIAAVIKWLEGNSYIEPGLGTRDRRPMTLPNGIVAQPGDWIINDGVSVFVYSNEKFLRTFEAIP